MVSKTIKNTTAFSDGTVSVSYAVVQQVKKIMDRENLRKICMVGLGKMGHNTLKYLLQHTPDAKVTLVNRDEKKLEEISSANQLKAIPFNDLAEAVRESEIVIIATGVAEPILHLNQVKGTTVKYIFDLAMPRNVGPEVYALDEITVFDVDQISATVNETLDKRL